MKIKKIKSQGEFCYPATIAAAVKDANFKKDDVVMTLGEVNLYLNNKDGDLNNLTTTHKDNLVNAINDVNDALSDILNVDATYELSIDDNGFVSCVKNATAEGFAIDSDGFVSLSKE